MHDRSSAPATVANRTDERRIEANAALRRLRLTGAEIAEVLGMALSTVSGILTRIGMGKLGRLGLEPAQRYERKRPGELLHIDVKKLGRIQNGRYLRPLILLLMKVPLFKRWIERGSRAAMERTNPELASAMRKLEPHQKHLHDPARAQKAMSQLTKQERAALLEMQEQQGGLPPEATNREMRRRLEKAQKAGRKR